MLSFGTLHQTIVLNCVPHVQHNNFSSFSQSDHCFVASLLWLLSSLLKLPVDANGFFSHFFLFLFLSLCSCTLSYKSSLGTSVVQQPISGFPMSWLVLILFFLIGLGYLSDLKYTTIPRRRGEQWWIYTETRSFEVYIHCSSPIDPEGDSCFSIYHIRWIKKRFFNFFF